MDCHRGPHCSPPQLPSNSSLRAFLDGPALRTLSFGSLGREVIRNNQEVQLDNDMTFYMHPS